MAAQRNNFGALVVFFSTLALSGQASGMHIIYELFGSSSIPQEVVADMERYEEYADSIFHDYGLNPHVRLADERCAITLDGNEVIMFPDECSRSSIEASLCNPSFLVSYFMVTAAPEYRTLNLWLYDTYQHVLTEQIQHLPENQLAFRAEQCVAIVNKCTAAPALDHSAHILENINTLLKSNPALVQQSLMLVIADKV